METIIESIKEEASEDITKGNQEQNDDYFDEEDNEQKLLSHKEAMELFKDGLAEIIVVFVFL